MFEYAGWPVPRDDQNSGICNKGSKCAIVIGLKQLNMG